MNFSSYYYAEDGTKIWYATSWNADTHELPDDEIPLILCDGFACDGFIWPYLIDHFHEEYHIVRWHYRGHGESENPADPQAVSMEDLCEDLLRLLDLLGLEKVHLLGHSMGIQVILTFCHLNPDRVATLIPMCGTYKRPLDTLKNDDTLGKLLPYIDKAVNMMPDQLQFMWETIMPSKLSSLLSKAEINGALVRQSDFLPYLQHVAEMDIRVYVAMLKELAEHTAEDYLPDIQTPTLIITGEKDTFTPTYRSVEMHEMMPDSELLIVPNGTHIAPLELPDLVNAAVEKFLRKH